MVQIRRKVYKGVCHSCQGSGWDESIEEEPLVAVLKKRKPTSLCLGKCTKCGGIGRHIDFE